jgi:glycine dehydrogenase
MLAIRAEIEAVERGEWAVEDIPLRHAPHHQPTTSSTDRRSRALSTAPRATTPVRSVGDKYWPPVSRIDQAYGDRNLMCACPPVEAYLDDSRRRARPFLSLARGRGSLPQGRLGFIRCK